MLIRQSYKFLIVSLLVFSVGCNKPIIVDKKSEVVYTSSENELADAMKNISVEELEKLYKIQIGIVRYLSTVDISKAQVTTIDILGGKPIDGSDDGLVRGLIPISSNVYSRVSDKDYTKAVEVFFKDNGYGTDDDLPKTLVKSVGDPSKEISCDKVIKDFETLSNATKLSLERRMKDNEL